MGHSSDDRKHSVKLKGVLDKMADWVYVRNDGTLVVEQFDFSESAEAAFGNDVAFLLFVERQDKSELARRLLRITPPDDEDEQDLMILAEMKKRFADHFAVREWIEGNSVPHRKDFDSWA